VLPAARGSAAGAASREPDFITTCLNATTSVCQISHLNRSEGEKERGRQGGGESNQTRIKPHVLSRERTTNKRCIASAAVAGVPSKRFSPRLTPEGDGQIC